MRGVALPTSLVTSPGMGQFGMTPTRSETYLVCGGSGTGTTFHTTAPFENSLSPSHQEKSSCSKSRMVGYITWTQPTNKISSSRDTSSPSTQLRTTGKTSQITITSGPSGPRSYRSWSGDHRTRISLGS